MRVIGVKEWEETVLGAWSSISVLYSGNHEASPAKYSAFFLLVTSATASNSQLGGCLPLLLQLRMPETPSTTADPSCRHRHTSTVLFRALWAGMILVQIQKTLTDSFPEGENRGLLAPGHVLGAAEQQTLCASAGAAAGGSHLARRQRAPRSSVSDFGLSV